MNDAVLAVNAAVDAFLAVYAKWPEEAVTSANNEPPGA
jgi:hypothetical protein